MQRSSIIEETAAEQNGEAEKQGYVPDLQCPHCLSVVHLPLPTYAWYNGEVGCQDCQSRFTVRIGSWERSLQGGPQGRTTPFGNTVQGGILLAPPKLLTEGQGLPRILTRDIDSSQLPDEVKTAIRGAIRHYDRADHLASIIRCRSTLEIALAEVTIPRDHLAVMSKRARANGVITEGVDNLCRAVAFFGGKAAHPQSRPELQVTRQDALTVICITIQVLRHLFLETESL